MNPIRPLIAVTDDEDSVRKALARLLRSANMDVITFASGSDFLAAVGNIHVDCVVLDLHMPRVSGFEVQLQLARLGNRAGVVIITGHDSPESRARALAGGAAAYLLKPIDEQVLLDAIALALAQT